MHPQIQIDSDYSFLLIVNWNEKTQDDLLSLIKKKIYQEYIDVFKEEKENIQNSFLMREEFFSEDANNIIDKTKIDEIAHLKKINKYFYSLKISGAETYISINNQLKMISEINKNNYTVININKSYEKKEYLIFFAMIFNQLIIFIIIIFFYRSIPNNFK
jgi:S-adenosylhomocysteine hydrolase